jgi:hypothetical protein
MFDSITSGAKPAIPALGPLGRSEAACSVLVLNLTLYAELAHPRADAPMTAVEREQALLICAATQEVGEV